MSLFFVHTTLDSMFPKMHSLSSDNKYIERTLACSISLPPPWLYTRPKGVVILS